MSVQAMKAGAVEFLTKPFGDEALLNAIRQELERSRAALDYQAEIHELRQCYKQVGGELGIREITVKAH